MIDKIFEFDRKALFKRNFHIFNRYDSLDNFNLKEPTTFINNFDKYLLHTIEEVIEYNQTEYTDFSEFVDILNYTGTTGSIILHLAELHEVQLEKFSEYDFNFSSTIIFDTLSLSIVESLIDIRRLIPHRKWHKNNKDKIINVDKFIREAWYNLNRALIALLHIGRHLKYEVDSINVVSIKKVESIIEQSGIEGI